MGFVGDTQPYQSAAALCCRYSNTEAAQGLRWLAGEWPTGWMQYTLRWAMLGGFDRITAKEPRELAYLDLGCNTLYVRSDWTDDATWVLFENAPFVSAHGSLDSGTFEIFKGDLLAARTGNLDHANVGAPHAMNYLHRTIAGNCLLIHDPQERWRGFLGGASGSDDGGGQRTNFPLGSSPDAQTYVTYRELFQRGQITRSVLQSSFAYAYADLTPAYNNPRVHGGTLNRPKVSNISRQILYLRSLDSMLVFDRISSLRPEFKKTWLLHSLGELDVVDGAETRLDPGQFTYENASRAVIRYGWPKPEPSYGRCLSVTLLPERPQLIKIGGRLYLPASETEAFPGDQWHGKHRHRHIKDFWVAGTNYPPGNPPETRWFGQPGNPDYVPGTPDESGGRGKWRLEVSPPLPALHDNFFPALPTSRFGGLLPYCEPPGRRRLSGRAH
jgi:heparin/heparan-sulfate lyase